MQLSTKHVATVQFSMKSDVGVLFLMKQAVVVQLSPRMIIFIFFCKSANKVQCALCRFDRIKITLQFLSNCK